MSTNFRSRYNLGKYVQETIKFEPSKTQQCFKEECDINEIVRRPNMGINPFSTSNLEANFGDFSDLVDFHEAQNIVCRAKSAFESMPSKARDYFHNNVNEFVNFINEGEKNIELGVELGIYEKSALEKISPVETVETTVQAVSQPIPSTSAESSAQPTT